MRYFPLFDFQMVVLLSFLGLAALLLLYVTLSRFTGPGSQPEKEEERETYPGGIETQNNPVPLVLVVVYAGFVIWAVAYVLVVGMRGLPF